MTEDPDITVGLLAAKFDDEYPDSAAEWVADRAVRSIRQGDRTRLLADLLRDRIEWRRRSKAHAIEQRAAQASEQKAAIDAPAPRHCGRLGSGIRRNRRSATGCGMRTGRSGCADIAPVHRSSGLSRTSGPAYASS